MAFVVKQKQFCKLKINLNIILTHSFYFHLDLRLRYYFHSMIKICSFFINYFLSFPVTICAVCFSLFCFVFKFLHCMTFTPAFYEQARRKKKEEAANAKILEAEKRNKVSKMTFKKKTEVFFFWCQIP